MSSWPRPPLSESVVFHRRECAYRGFRCFHSCPLIRNIIIHWMYCDPPYIHLLYFILFTWSKDMAKIFIVCEQCGSDALLEVGAVNRARKGGLRIFCGRKCAGMARRTNKTKAQKVEEKRLYDIEFRVKNRERIKREKAERFKRTYDPEKARVERRANMARHIEYCRRPEYKEHKRKYDRAYRAKSDYGEFWESFLLVMDIDKEVDSRMTDYEVRQINGTNGKTQKRRREYERLIGNKS
jgi:hypothetical protein